MDSTEFQESTTVRLEWTVRGLQQLFESSKGEIKSKVTKSVKFGGGRWQILFYPNSGTEGGQYVSLYLSCEPTPGEKESGIDGRWIRAGLYKFNFELRNLSKTILFSQKEANDHSFSWKTANWGWSQFARRESIYYGHNTIRNNDAFLIICSISSSPTAPSVPSLIPQRLVPKALLDVVGSLLDDPAYSDVEFVLLAKCRSSGRKPRRIYAARSILERAEYFESMFGSGFAEAASQDMELSASQRDNVSGSDSELDLLPSMHSQPFEDSDEEDEAELIEHENSGTAQPGLHLNSLTGPPPPAEVETFNDSLDTVVVPFDPDTATSSAPPALPAEDTVEDKPDVSISNEADCRLTEERNVRAKISHPSSPRQGDGNDDVGTSYMPHASQASHNPPKKTRTMKYRVVVKDVAYVTYRAVLYYLYTDCIVFAPLASTFLEPPSTTGLPSSQSLASRTQGEGQNVNPAFAGRSLMPNDSNDGGPKTRIAWIREWERHNPGKPTPCSAKAVYRIADKLGLSELKSRAFRHLLRSLTIHNVPYEMFSSFSSTFEDVRKTQVAFFLDHWNEIRTSQSMQIVWQQIRAGRHPGFEEVWPLIAMNLEFRPHPSDVVDGDNREGNGETRAVS